jgi:DNA-binding CsgD family transcriptional regulator
MAGGVHEGQGSGVVLMTADTAAGEAIAFACARRGTEVSVSEIGRVGAAGAEILMVDLQSLAAASQGDLPGRPYTGIRWVIAIGEPTAGTAGVQFDAWVALDDGIDELIAAVSDISRARALPRSAVTSDLVLLTPRERQVIALLLAGLNSEEMATHLGIATNTVRTHVQNVLTKIGVSSRAEAAAWAVRAGFEPCELAGKTVT